MSGVGKGNFAYPYASGTQIAQGIAGRNKKAAQVTNTAHRNWLTSARQKGEAAATMERELEYRLDSAGIRSGNAKATTTRSGTYLTIPHQSATGKETRVSHFSAHPVANPTMLPSAIGPFHAKTTTNGQSTYQARAVPDFERHSGKPIFGNQYVAVKGKVPAPRTTSVTPVVYEALGHAYTTGLHQHMAGSSTYRGYGGNKRRKTSKRKHSRKSHTRRR